MRKYTFEDFTEIVKSRLELINWEKDKFTYEVNNIDELIDNLIIKYNNKILIIFTFYISNYITKEGTLGARAIDYITLINESEWYLGKNFYVSINEFFECRYNDKNKIALGDLLNEVLPISRDSDVAKIRDQLMKESINNFEIKFETLNNRYIIIGDISSILIGEKQPQENGDENLRIYKYMPLDTYFSMLIHKTFRMNSIVAMNDKSESFFLDEAITNRYDGEGRDEKHVQTIENSRVLITSFTDKYDSALMWRLYGDLGKGVCLGFEVPKKKVRKIHYVSTQSKGYQKLKRCVDNLKKDGILLNFKDFDSLKYYAKSDGFNHEDEYRLSYHCAEEDLRWAKYGNLISPYKDFTILNGKLEDLDIKLISLEIGGKLPNFEVNYPLLVDMTNRNIGISHINISEHNKFRE